MIFIHLYLHTTLFLQYRNYYPHDINFLLGTGAALFSQYLLPFLPLEK